MAKKRIPHKESARKKLAQNVKNLKHKHKRKKTNAREYPDEIVLETDSEKTVFAHHELKEIDHEMEEVDPILVDSDFDSDRTLTDSELEENINSKHIEADFETEETDSYSHYTLMDVTAGSEDPSMEVDDASSMSSARTTPYNVSLESKFVQRFIDAAERGDLNIVKNMWNSPMVTTMSMNDKGLALLRASQSGSLSVVDFLLSQFGESLTGEYKIYKEESLLVAVDRKNEDIPIAF